MQRIAIIGGSGLYQLEGLEIIDELDIETPYGSPSDKICLARMHDHELIFLPRHGRHHHIPPHKINYRANIYALKVVGVTKIISISAVGSLKEEIAPGHFVMVDQFVDRTHGRASSFFDGPVVAHASMAEPTCHGLRQQLLQACQQVNITTHAQGSYLAMQGPQFSSKAESNLYRSWGMDVIGMTNMPEAKLAREAEICYATVAMSTDYDCWREEDEAVSATSVIEVMQRNTLKANQMLSSLFQSLADTYAAEPCKCQHILEQSLFTNLHHLTDEEIRPVYAIVKRLL